MHSLLPKLIFLMNVATSSKEDWASSGTMYFNNHKYSQAAYCFNRAGMTYEYEVANAYHLRLQARKLPRDTERNKKSDAYSLAAEAFHKSASHIRSHKRLKLYYRISAECYQEAERFIDAAKGYEIAEEYAKSAYSFMKGGNYDKTKEILKTKSAKLDSEDVEEITLKCRLHYLRRGKIEYVFIFSKPTPLTFVLEMLQSCLTLLRASLSLQRTMGSILNVRRLL